ncbi:MAG TPA: hypothetical protein VFZ34_17725 [Blastocatellia bacterium]|nr:hypothetical protein [Blastocatellia bacterium]
MKNLQQHAATTRAALSLIMILLTSVLALAQTPDSDKIWTAAATTGAVDESSLGTVVFTDSLATLTPPAPATGTIRYSVVAMDGLFGNLTPTSWPELVIRYRDNGQFSRVYARLREHILSGPQAGQTNTLITFDSDLYAQSGAFQTRTIGNCGVFPGFRFTDPPTIRVYYVEVELSKSGTAGFPGLAGLAIDRYGVCLGGAFQSSTE